ncbi:CHAD domain-containing protein [Nocardia terpenica]|uniref:CHAD domain-containing protein n=1 Tax=Nocardia terpenica TaxID=455432 RepID=A0A6G9Z0M1_9NOCA|nr:CHAD domain-containing protein [Nocardia terpenica]QIS19004.1 CHAD domain-containing protein [Nocardia terpenica]
MPAAAGPALVAALTDDVDRLLAAEPAVRDDIPDAVHKMRVATRRLRSVLRSYRKVFHRTPIDETRSELRWLAGVLGVARDAEVRAERFAAHLDEQSAQERRIGRRLVAAERARYAAAHRVVLEALDSQRYTRLVRRLEELRTDPPLRRKRSRREATKVFATVLRTEFRALRRLIKAEPEVAEDAHVEHLHDIRKAAKRLRYAAEAADEVLDGPAVELAGRAKKLQSVLGDHRDAIEAMTTIRHRATRARSPHGIAAYDRMYHTESAAARKALSDYPAAAEFLLRSNN